MGKTNIRSVDLNLLAVFDALFDERSVTRAAGRLALTQPPVSGMLARLRHDFGDELFVRTSHGVLPTPRAEELAVPIKALLVDARALFEPAEFDPARETFTVRICGSDLPLQWHLSLPCPFQPRRRFSGVPWQECTQHSFGLGFPALELPQST